MRSYYQKIEENKNLRVSQPIVEINFTNGGVRCKIRENIANIHDAIQLLQIISIKLLLY